MAVLKFLLAAFLSTTSLQAGTWLEDHRQNRFQLGSPKQRIVSAFVGSDEIIVALLKEQSHRVLALSPLARDVRYSSISLEAKQWKIFGEELESLVLLKPDLVIAARYTRPEWIDMLQKAKIPTFVLGRFASLEDIMSNIFTLGQLLDREPAAEKLVAEMKSSLAALQKNCGLRGKTVMNYSETGQIYGEGTTFSSMMQWLGAANLGQELGVKGWALVSQERIIRSQVDYVVIEGKIEDRSRRLTQLRAESPWKHLKAVQEGRLIHVPSHYLSSVSQHIVRGMEIACGQI